MLFLFVKLLYRDKFSIEGARRALKDVKFAMKKEKNISSAMDKIDENQSYVQEKIRSFILEIRKTREIFNELIAKDVVMFNKFITVFSLSLFSVIAVASSDIHVVKDGSVARCQDLSDSGHRVYKMSETVELQLNLFFNLKLCNVFGTLQRRRLY